MKLSQVNGMVKLNIHDTFVVMATKRDVIMTSLVRKIRILKKFKKNFFQGYFLLFC